MDKVKIAFFSNFLNHHQALVADELYRKTNGQYVFVELMQMPEWIAKSGYPDYSAKPYLLQAWKDKSSMFKAKNLAIDAEVALFAGFEVLELEKFRIANTDKITFDVSERWLKRGIFNLLSTRIMKLYFAYQTGHWSQKPVYKLCSSAFAASDHKKLHMYEGKCFKWGYFTKVPKEVTRHKKKSDEEPVRMMWCARFLDWKHPELPIKLAALLKDSGYHFHIDMYGTGRMLEKMKQLATRLNINEVLSFCGNKPNAEILEEMGKHDIFLFTSDKNEGWGAVANEAMSQGCVVVGSDEIGSVPYLITDKETGMIFKSCDIDSLFKSVITLIDNPELREFLSENGILAMQYIWSPKNAATSLLNLIHNLQNGIVPTPNNGPCSLA